MAHRLTYWENKNRTIEESKKYASRLAFCKGSHGAYTVSKKNGWLDEMDWLPKDTKHPRGYWDDIKNVINEAKKYSSKHEIKEKEPYLYKIMFKKGYINKLDWLK